jgi:DNA-binding response OmpR family regulator
VSRRTFDGIGGAKVGGPNGSCGKHLSHSKRCRILSISATPEDYHALRTILTDPLWEITKACTCKEAIARLSRKRIPVVVCEYDLPDGSWRDILNHMAEFADPPVLIVTSRLADEHLWAEVLNLGGFDILAKPFRESEVAYAIAAACRQKNIPIPRQSLVASA